MRTVSVCVVTVCLLAAGCGPNIQQINPDPANEYQLVTVEGDRMLGATISVNGVPVGAAYALAGSDPIKRRDVVVPQGPGAATFEASDLIGHDTQSATVLSSSADPINFNIIGHTVTPLGVDFVIHGTGVYPGANVPNKPFAGPMASAIDLTSGGSITAQDTAFLWDRTYSVHFDPTPFFVNGHDYKIEITNYPEYGGLSGQSGNMITMP
jgi:hypothetical protein